MKSTLLFILIPLLVFNQDTDWKLKIDKNDVKVYTRDYVGSDYVEYRAKTMIDAPIQTIYDVIMDGDALHVWNYKTITSRTVKDIDDNTRVIYMQIDMPWPLRNRDNVSRITTEKFEDGSIKMTILPDPEHLVAINDDFIRLESFIGYWLLKPTDNGVQVTQQMWGDPMGSIPSWAVNSAIVKNPYNSFLHLKKHIQSKL